MIDYKDVQDIRRSQCLSRIPWKTGEWIDSRKIKFSWGKNPNRYIVIAIMLFNHILRKCSDEYKLRKSQDNFKLFAKNEKESETLIQAVRICSQNIRMDFGLQKCAMLIMRSRKRQMTEGIELLNQEKIRPFGEKETYKWLGKLEANTIKQAEMKEKFKNKHFWITGKLFKTKIYSRNLIKGINTWA